MHTTWPKRTASFWEEAPFFRLLPALILGILAYDRNWLGLQQSHWLTAATLLALAAAVALLFVRSSGATVRMLRFATLQAGLFLLGALFYFSADARQAPDWYGNSQDKAEAYLARITSQPLEKQNSRKQEITLLRAIAGDHSRKVSGMAYLSVYRSDAADPFHYGDTIVIPAILQPIGNTGNPFEFDYKTFCRRRNIFDQVFAPAGSVGMYAAAGAESGSWLERGHDWSVRQLKAYLPDSASFGLLQAMLMGDERDFDPELRRAYSETGVVHIVSISGSHTAVLFGVITALFFWLRRPRWQWIKYVVGVLMVWVYVLMAGAPPSALRSAIMFTVFALSFMTGREQQHFNTLCMAAFGLLCAEPVFLFSVGFQLSFVAVLSLLIFYPPVYQLWVWPRQWRASRMLWQLCAASFAVEILTAPLVIYYFHNFPLLFLPANIASFALVGFFALVGGMAILAFSWWPWLAHWIGIGVSCCVRLFDVIVLWLQRHSPESMRHIVLTLPELLLLYAAITCFAIGWLRKKRALLLPALSFSCVLLFVMIFQDYRALRQEKLIVYNANKQTIITAVDGMRNSILVSDTDLSGNRMVVQANDLLHAWRTVPNALGEVFRFGEKTVLLLNRRIAATEPLPVDVLILSDSVQFHSLQDLQSQFSPKQLVVTGRQKRYLLKQWADSARILHIPLHATSLDQGAFVLE